MHKTFEDAYTPSPDAVTTFSAALDVAQRGIEDTDQNGHYSKFLGGEIRDPETGETLGRIEMAVLRWSSTSNERLCSALEAILERVRPTSSPTSAGWTSRNQNWIG